MKIVDQAVPPDLLEVYEELISTNAAGASAGEIARTRRGARLPQGAPVPSDQSAALAHAADALVRKWKSRLSLAAQPGFRARRLDELRRGIFEPLYWTACPVTSETFITSTPTSEPDPAPPDYEYREGDNLPSLPEYPEGVESSAPCGYFGSTDAGYFNDEGWSWKRNNLDLIRPIEDWQEEAALLELVMGFHIDTDARGSRPMLSALVAPKLCNDGDPILTDLTPPIANAKSLYWRYRIPVTVAPYFHLDYERRAIVALSPSSVVGGVLPVEKASIAAGPRPMFGRGFNNCTSVDISADITTNLYMIEPPGPANGLPVFRRTSGQWRSINIETGETTATPGQPGDVQLNQGANTLARVSSTNQILMYGADLSLRATVAQPYGTGYATGNLTPVPEGWECTYQRPHPSYPTMAARLGRAGAMLALIPQSAAEVPPWSLGAGSLLGPSGWFAIPSQMGPSFLRPVFHNIQLGIYRQFSVPKNVVACVINAAAAFATYDDGSIYWARWSDIEGDSEVPNATIVPVLIQGAGSGPVSIWALNSGCYVTRGTASAWFISSSGFTTELPPLAETGYSRQVTAGLWPTDSN